MAGDAANRKGKPHADERARRLAFVEELLAKATPLKELYPAFEAAFGVTRRPAERAVRKVFERWEREGRQQVDRERKRHELEARLERIARKAEKLGDANPKAAHMAYRTAILATDTCAKLYGLVNERVDVRHSGAVEHHHTIDADALCDRIDALAVGLAAPDDPGGAAEGAAPDEPDGAGGSRG